MPQTKDILDLLILTILPALAMAALVMAAVERLGGANQAPAGAALGLIAGVTVGMYLKNVYPFQAPADLAWNRLPWAALIALAVGRVAYLADVHSSDGWLLRGLAALGIAWWVIPESNREQIAWLAPALAAVIWATWMLVDLLAATPGSTSVAACLILCLLTAAGVMLFASIGKLMETSIILAAALTGVVVVAYSRHVEIGAVVPAVVVALPTILLLGHQTTAVKEIHWVVYLLPAVTPLTLALTLPCLHWPKSRLHAIRIALALIPLATALILARLQAGPLDLGEPEW